MLITDMLLSVFFSAGIADPAALLPFLSKVGQPC